MPETSRARVTQEQNAIPESAEEATAGIHDGIDRARSLVKQTAQAIREQLLPEGLTAPEGSPGH